MRIAFAVPQVAAVRLALLPLLSSRPPVLPSPLPLQLWWQVQPQQLRFISLSGVINQKFPDDQFFTREYEIHGYASTEGAVCKTVGIVQTTSLASPAVGTPGLSLSSPQLALAYVFQNSSISCSFLRLIDQSWAPV